MQRKQRTKTGLHEPYAGRHHYGILTGRGKSGQTLVLVHKEFVIPNEVRDLQ
jgi:hypothetical protein